MEVNELVIAVGNLLDGCADSPTPTMQCPINFSNDNTEEGTPDCFYIGRWNQSCGADDLEARWISDGIDDDGEADLVVVELIGFDQGLFLAAEVTSPTTADLFAWFTNPNPQPDDLMDTSGTVTLNAAGNLVIDPTTSPSRSTCATWSVTRARSPRWCSRMRCAGHRSSCRPPHRRACARAAPPCVCGRISSASNGRFASRMRVD